MVRLVLIAMTTPGHALDKRAPCADAGYRADTMGIVDGINGVSDNSDVRRAWFVLALTVFVCIIVVPSIFVVTKLFTDWGLIRGIFDDGIVMAEIRGAVANSFSIALIVTAIDVAAGLPIAWVMVRKEFRGRKALDTLLDMPLAFPTAVLGLSVIMFWCAPEGIDVASLGLNLSPYVLVLLLHIIFTYPYMVRSLSGILEQIDPNYETAAMTLGASRFTAAKTITLPLFKAGLVTGFILCFARSLSETGGTYIALELMGVKDAFFTGPTFLSFMRSDVRPHPEEYPDYASVDPTGAMIVISIIMIALALAMLFAAGRIINKFHMGGSRIWPEFERKISRGAAPKAKDAAAIAFMAFMVLLPSFYIFMYLAEPASVDLGELAGSMGTSFLVAAVAVAFDVVFGIPVAMHIARHRGKRSADAIDALVNVPLIIPTTALGFSLALFWGGGETEGAAAVILVILGHISFTYPLVVRNIAGAVEEVDPSFEETAMTLGAKPLQAFYRVLLPIIKSSVIAGCILAFTRSLGETGATIAISTDINTVPCYIVDLVKDKAYPEAAMCSIILIAVCFVLMFAVRMLTRGRGERHDRDQGEGAGQGVPRGSQGPRRFRPHRQGRRIPLPSRPHRGRQDHRTPRPLRACRDRWGDGGVRREGRNGGPD